MNTTDPAPPHSSDVPPCFLTRYPSVNLVPRKNTRTRESGRESPIDVVMVNRILPAPAAKHMPGSPTTLAVSGPLSRRHCVRVAQSAFGKAFVDQRQQCDRRERLAQASHRAEFESHSQEVRRRRVEIRKGISRHRNQRNSRRALVEYPDRFQAAPMPPEHVCTRQAE